MPMLPNPKYELYAQERAKGAGPTAAYEAAGYAKNKGNCHRLEKIPEIQERIAELLHKAADKTEITVERIMAELGKIGFSDIRSLFTETGSLKRVEDLDDAAAGALSAIEVVTRKVPGGDEDEVEHVAKIKLWDKRAALVDLGKQLGMFKERVEHTGKDGGPIEVVDMTETEKARRIAFALARGAKQAETSH